MSFGGETMGTSWQVQLAAGGVDPARARDLAAERLSLVVAQMSHWDRDSVLSRFNASRADTWTRLPPGFAAVMRTALEVAAVSGGGFDPAAGALVDLWGHGPPGSRVTPTGAAIADALSHGGWRALRWDEAGSRLRQPGSVRLDLSGIAKGYAVDLVAAALARIGVRHFLVEIGGELAGRGVRPDGEPWWVDLEAPPGLAVAPLRLALHGIAVATSGSYVRGEHTLDPRAGRPVANNVVSVSVIADSAMLADALATAITVCWPDIDTLLARYPVAARIITGDATEHLTPTLRTMLSD